MPVGTEIFDTPWRTLLLEYLDGLTVGGGGLTEEEVDDRVAALLVAGSNITLTYNDVANTLTIASTTVVPDGDKGDITVSSSGTVWTVDNLAINDAKINDVAVGKITGFGEAVDDQVAALIVAGAGITATYSDVANTLTLASTITQYTDEMARDALGAALTAGTGMTVTVNDGADTITLATTITQYTDEMARDALGAALTAGTGISISVNDGADTITINSTITQYTDEMARDALGTALTAGSGITITPNDVADTITITSSITQYTDEMVDDRVAALLVAGSNITLTYDDVANTLTIAAAGSSGVADGDKGDIVVSSSGTVWTVDTNVISNSKFRQSAGLSVVGRATNTTGDVADITASADNQVFLRSGTSLVFGTVATGGITNNAVDDTKLRDSAALSVIGRPTNSSGDPSDITASADNQVLRRSGTALGFGTVATGGIADDAVTYAKMQNISAQNRILARKSVSAGDPEECTLSEVLDMITSTARGDLLFRGASAWQRLAAGTAGYFLQTNSTTGDPAWVAAPGSLVFLSSAAASNSAALNFSGFFSSTYDVYVFEAVGIVPATDGTTFGAQYSISGSYITANYRWGTNDPTENASGNAGGSAQSFIRWFPATGNASGESGSGHCRLYLPLSTTLYKHLRVQSDVTSTTTTHIGSHGGGFYSAATSALDAIRFLMASGNITSGTVYMWGLKKAA